MNFYCSFYIFLSVYYLLIHQYLGFYSIARIILPIARKPPNKHMIFNVYIVFVIKFLYFFLLNTVFKKYLLQFFFCFYLFVSILML